MTKLTTWNTEGMESLRLRQLNRLLVSVDGLNCVAVGGSGLLHSMLRNAGGKWFGLAWDRQDAEELASYLQTEVWDLEGGVLPFRDGVLDLIVVLEGLEDVRDDYAFVADCHRALKPNGRLLVNVRLLKKWSLLPFNRNVYTQRQGYTEPQLFDILKDGFDVQHATHYGRFFAELANGLRLARPFFSFANFLDKFLFLNRGYNFMALAKRRPWRPRRTPVLSDGRSIAEAALQSKIGTAFEF